MKKLILLSLVLTMASCNNVKGTFTALVDLNFKGGTTVTAGEHKAELKIRKRSLTLEFSEDKKVKFVVPKNTDLPDRNGELTLTSGQVKQPFDVQGKVATEVTDGDSRRDYESCTYREPYQVCYVDDRGRRKCYTEYRDVRGYRNVQYFVRTEDKSLVVSLYTPGTNILSASFNGRDLRRFRVYEYEGICR